MWEVFMEEILLVQTTYSETYGRNDKDLFRLARLRE
jgi:hypothetical protein